MGLSLPAKSSPGVRFLRVRSNQRTEKNLMKKSRGTGEMRHSRLVRRLASAPGEFKKTKATRIREFKRFVQASEAIKYFKARDVACLTGAVLLAQARSIMDYANRVGRDQRTLLKNLKFLHPSGNVTVQKYELKALTGIGTQKVPAFG